MDMYIIFLIAPFFWLLLAGAYHTFCYRLETSVLYNMCQPTSFFVKGNNITKDFCVYHHFFLLSVGLCSSGTIFSARMRENMTRKEKRILLFFQRKSFILKEKKGIGGGRRE